MSSIDFVSNAEIDISYDSVKIEGFDYNSYSTKASVKWSLIMDLRQWGIKDFCFIVPNQTISLSLELENTKDEDPQDPYVEIELEVELSDIDVNDPTGRISDTHLYNLEIELISIVKVSDTTYKAKGTAVASFSSIEE